MTTQSSRAERLAEIAERAEKATDGPWSADGWNRLIKWAFAYGAERDGEVLLLNALEQNPDQVTRHDAAFIAHARSDIPWLLSELEAADNGLVIVGGYLKVADAENARLRSALEEAKEALDIFLSGRFDVALGGNPIATEKALRRAAEVRKKLDTITTQKSEDR